MATSSHSVTQVAAPADGRLTEGQVGPGWFFAPTANTSDQSAVGQSVGGVRVAEFMKAQSLFTAHEIHHNGEY